MQSLVMASRSVLFLKLLIVSPRLLQGIHRSEAEIINFVLTAKLDASGASDLRGLLAGEQSYGSELCRPKRLS
jgi:hypothetical protein